MRLATMLLAGAFARAAGMEDLSFMAGCWTGPNMEEHWMKPEGGTMLGMSRTLKGGKTVFTEFHLIAEDNGTPVLNVQLRLATKTTPFRLTESGGKQAVFSNPEHDFPQRIIYRATPDGLFARIEGNYQGQVKGQDFPMRRCK
jgi:hypothetical protein